jgi:hypothetical protein
MKTLTPASQPFSFTPEDLERSLDPLVPVANRISEPTTPQATTVVMPTLSRQIAEEAQQLNLFDEQQLNPIQAVNPANLFSPVQEPQPIVIERPKASFD